LDDFLLFIFWFRKEEDVNDVQDCQCVEDEDRNKPAFVIVFCGFPHCDAFPGKAPQGCEGEYVGIDVVELECIHRNVFEYHFEM